MLATDGGAGGAVDIPKGDPDALLGAAGLWAGMAEMLSAQGRTITSTADATSLADWVGPASSAFAGSAALVAGDFEDAAGACHRAAAACRTFGHALRDAQHRAREAKRDADAAGGARRRLDDANAAAEAARGRAIAAAGREMTASAAGPAGAHVVAAARAEQDEANDAAATAQGDARRAGQALDDAQDAFDKAVKRGRDANDDAERAADHATSAFAAVAADARPPSLVGPPAVPVSIPGDGDPLRHISPFSSLASAFGTTPADVRRRQIAAEEDARRAAEKRQAGDWDDAFGGMAAAWTGTDFGIGDPRTTAYKGNKWWNEKLALVPTPGSVGKHVIKEGVEKSIEAEARRAAEHRIVARGPGHGPMQAPPKLPGNPRDPLRHSRTGAKRPTGPVAIGRGNLAERGVLRPGEQHLDLPWQRDPRLDWRQNAGQLRDAMREGRPIRDTDPADVRGPFLNAERGLLRSRGWKFDEQTGYWMPPHLQP